jgi:biopolymer transport protein ExbD
MSLKKTSQRSHGTMAELNITPLLDLVFVLLVIFIITTPQLMNNLEMNLPSGKPPPKDNRPKPRINRIVLNAAGIITLNDEFVTVAQLKDKLAALKTANPDLAVVVKGADDVDYQHMVAVLDTLQ